MKKRKKEGNPVDPDDLPFRKGVGAALFDRSGRVWLGLRKPKKGQKLDFAWQMPQGGIDDGEDPAKAVFRELLEETGTDKAEIYAETEGWLTYDLPEHLIGVAWGGKYRGQKQKWFALRFLGEDGDFDLNYDKKPEFTDWCWAPLEEAPRLVVPFKRTLYEELVRQFRSVPERVSAKK